MRAGLRVTNWILACVVLVSAWLAPWGSDQGLAGTPERVWSLVPAEHVGVWGNDMDTVEAISRDDIWATGDAYLGTYPDYLTHTAGLEHWDGRIWRAVPFEEPVYESLGLSDLSAVASDDVWMVGGYVRGREKTLIEHWNGDSWRIVPSPNALYYSYLFDVADIGTGDVWAVGTTHREDFSGSLPLVLHWDGEAWSRIPAPGDAGKWKYDSLGSVAVISPTDVWAGGCRSPSGSYIRHPQAMHWDGERWRRFQVPSAYDACLVSLAAVSSMDVWAIGTLHTKEGHLRTLAMHWDGAAWTRVPTPNPGSVLDDFNGVAALSSTYVVAVGVYAGTSPRDRPLVERWDGESWKVIRNEPLLYNSGFSAVVALGPRELWAVGEYANSFDEGQRILTERFGVPFCSDGEDNDGDGAVDYLADDGCTSAIEGSEFGTAQCDDGWDNDADDLIDYPTDPGCTSRSDDQE